MALYFYVRKRTVCYFVVKKNLHCITHNYMYLSDKVLVETPFKLNEIKT